MADRVLLVGSGAREHALAEARLRHGDVESLIPRERVLAAVVTLDGPSAHRTDFDSPAALRAKAAHPARLRGSRGTR